MAPTADRGEQRDRRSTVGRLKRQRDRGVLATGVERGVGDVQREGLRQRLTTERLAGGEVEV
nr:hypothetical protein Itr_chr15CG08070 [Ipomoea trifida]